MTGRSLWILTVQYYDEQAPYTNVYDNPNSVQEMLAATMYAQSFISIRSLRLELVQAGEIELSEDHSVQRHQHPWPPPPGPDDSEE